MSEVTLTITIKDEENVIARRDDGGEETGRLNLGDLRHDTIDVFEAWLRENKITHAKELRVMGSHLYQALFDEKIKTFFETTRQQAAGERMRVQLRFRKEAAHLATLPWEYLYCPDSETGEGYFLSTNVDLVLSRFVYREKGEEPQFTDQDPLKILIVVSSPPPLQIDAAPVIDVLRKLRDYFKNYQINIDVLERPTVLSLYEKLKMTNPHIVHFIGRGRFDQTKGLGEIALLDPAGNVFWQEDKDFADIFVQAKPVTSLVFLHLCQEAMTDLKANFAGLAPRLIQAHIKAVVAMHYPIYNAAAVIFCRYFYRELLNQAKVDDAVQTARSRIKFFTPIETPQVRDFGTPALYMYSSESLIPPPAPTPSTQGTKETGNVGIESEPHRVEETDTLVENILAAGEEAIDKMTLALNEKMACYQEIAELSTELAGKSPAKAKQTLRVHFLRATGKVKLVVLAMMESV